MWELIWDKKQIETWFIRLKAYLPDDYLSGGIPIKVFFSSNRTLNWTKNLVIKKIYFKIKIFHFKKLQKLNFAM